MHPDRSIRHSACAPAAVLTAALLVLLLPMTVHALSCAVRNFTLAEAYEDASSIIIGIVTECREPVSRDPWTNGGADCSFDSLEVLKASKPARDYRGVASSQACGLSLQVGSQYLLFLDDQNRPLYYSAALDGDRSFTQLPHAHATILRQFRDGRVADLSGPWFFQEFADTCAMSHSAGGHVIAFRKPKSGTRQPTVDFTREVVDGRAVIRAKAVPVGESPSLDPPIVEIVMPADAPEYPPDGIKLSVTLLEGQPAPERRAVLAVGSRSWPLYRVEMSIFFDRVPIQPPIEYHAGSGAAEEILAAMSEPSDVVVSASLVKPPDTADDSVGEAAPSTFGSFGASPPGATSSAPDLRDSTVTGPSMSTYPQRSTARQQRSEPPPPEIRLETRSTQLASVLEQFEGC